MRMAEDGDKLETLSFWSRICTYSYSYDNAGFPQYYFVGPVSRLFLGPETGVFGEQNREHQLTKRTSSIRLDYHLPTCSVTLTSSY